MSGTNVVGILVEDKYLESAFVEVDQNIYLD